MQGANSQITGNMPVRYAGYHASVIEVYDRAIVPDIPILQKQVCEIRAPFLVRLVRPEILFQPVLEHFVGLPRLFGADDESQAHLCVYVLMDGRGATPVPPASQIGRHATVAVDTVVAVVDVPDLLLDVCLLGIIVRLPVLPVVVVGIRT